MQQKDKYAPTSRHQMALWLFGIFPQILLVALCNSRAMGEDSENSDIDLIIIARKGQLWTVRFIVTCISSMFGIRRGNTHGLVKGSPEYTKKTKDKFCLSFFITEDAMNLDSIRIENDIYLDRWIKTLVPLVNKNRILEQFWTDNLSHQLKHGSTEALKHGSTYLETIIKKLWLKKTFKTYGKLGRPWGVVISDTMLKFHDNDQRKIYRDTHTKE